MFRTLKLTVFKTVAICAVLWVFTGQPATAKPPAKKAPETQSAPAPQASPVAGWDELIDSLRDLPARMLAKLPESARNDPQIQQEIGRLALEAIASSSLEAIGGDGDHPVFVASINQVLNVGQPNADTLYRMARITPGGSYRIRGERGSLRMVKIAQAGPSPSEPGFTPPAPGDAPRPHNDFNSLHTDRNGRYDVLLSPTRPAGYKGDWWQLEPTSNKLMLRMVSSNWRKEKDPTFSIERTDISVTRPRPSAANLEQRLRQLPRATNFIANLFVDRVEKLRAEGFTNKFKELKPGMGALAGQFYYESVYDLKDDEALIVEAKAPAKCVYRSLILTNEIYETTDWYNNHSSLNDSQAKVDKDGILRIVVSPKDPGVPNWLDTAGYPSGIIQGRWTECDSQPIPSAKKVALADVRASLPKETPVITPEQRERIIRDRRMALQQRPLW